MSPLSRAVGAERKEDKDVVRNVRNIIDQLDITILKQHQHQAKILLVSSSFHSVLLKCAYFESTCHRGQHSIGQQGAGRMLDDLSDRPPFQSNQDRHQDKEKVNVFRATSKSSLNGSVSLQKSSSSSARFATELGSTRLSKELSIASSGVSLLSEEGT